MPVGEFTLKGFRRPVAAFNVVAVRCAGAVPAVGRRPGWRIGGSRRWRSRSSDFVARSRSCVRRGSGWCWPPTADRGRIERELHDGAQQRLVALAVELQQARRLVNVHPAAAGALSTRCRRGTGGVGCAAGLAHRIHPPLLESGRPPRCTAHHGGDARRANARAGPGGSDPSARACRGRLLLLRRRTRAPRRDGERSRSPSAKRTGRSCSRSSRKAPTRPRPTPTSPRCATAWRRSAAG